MAEIIELNKHRKVPVFVLYEGNAPYTRAKIVYITRNPTEFFEALRSYMVLMVEGIEKKTTLAYKIATELMSLNEVLAIVDTNKAMLQAKLTQKQITSGPVPDSIEKTKLTLVPDTEDL